MTHLIVISTQGSLDVFIVYLLPAYSSALGIGRRQRLFKHPGPGPVSSTVPMFGHFSSHLYPGHSDRCQPFYLFSCGFQKRRCLLMLDARLRRVWPIHLQPNEGSLPLQAVVLFLATIHGCWWYIWPVNSPTFLEADVNKHLDLPHGSGSCTPVRHSMQRNRLQSVKFIFV